MSSVFKGFETKEITSKSYNVKPGDVVMLNSNHLAFVPEEGGAFCGVCSAVREDYASIIFNGYAQATFSGSIPKIGYVKLSADGQGGVKVDDENGREYFVVGNDNKNSTVDFIVR